METLQWLDEQKSRDHACITLIIPDSVDTSFIDKELASAQNIRSKHTRKAVISGLKKIKNHITTNVALFTDGSDIHVVKPPVPIKQFFYECGSKYNTTHIKPLFDRLNDKVKYGILLLHGEEFTILAANDTISVVS